jgi:hypothetical protein
MLKLHEMAECRITDARASLGMSHFRNIYSQDMTPQLLCQVARRPPGPAPNIQNGRPGRDPGSAREGKDFSGVSTHSCPMEASPCASAAAEKEPLRNVS